MPFWSKIAVIAAAILIICSSTIWLVGYSRWTRTSASIIERLKSEGNQKAFTHNQLAGLPAPVVRYFKHVLPLGQPMIHWARFEQVGTFRRGGIGAAWVPFKAVQHFSADPPGFVWDANIRMAPMMPVRVRDSYVDGSGSMKGALFSVFNVVNEHDKAELNKAALQRYLAEAAWFPTALLPSPDLTWVGLDENSALATLVDGATEATMEFHFNDEGEITRIYTDQRYYEEDGAFVPMPWQGHFRNYEERNGIRIPLEGEVEWILPEGKFAYWRGRIESVDFH